MHEVESLCDGRPDHCDLSPGEHATRIRDGEGTTGHVRAHFHRTYEETFIVVNGGVLLYDGLSWRHT